jgi:hypothetical protein
MATTKPFDRYIFKINRDIKDRIGLLLYCQSFVYVIRIDFYSNRVAFHQDYFWHPGLLEEYIVLHISKSRSESVMSSVWLKIPYAFDIERQQRKWCLQD